MMASVRSMRVPAASSADTWTDAFVGLRRQLGIEEREHEDRGDDRHSAHADDDRPMRQRLVQEPAIRVVHALEEALAHVNSRPPMPFRSFHRRWQLEQIRAEHRHERDGDEQRHQQREDDDHRQLLEEDARNARQEEQRHEHRDVRENRRDNRAPHLFRFLQSPP